MSVTAVAQTSINWEAGAAGRMPPIAQRPIEVYVVKQLWFFPPNAWKLNTTFIMSFLLSLHGSFMNVSLS